MPRSPVKFLPMQSQQAIELSVFRIGVDIRGVSDQPQTANVTIFATEDEVYELGQFVEAQLGANFDGILVDTDGSERLTFKLSGIDPTDLVFTEAFRNSENFTKEVNYLGAAEGYELSPQALLNARLLPDPDYSGTDPLQYSNLVIRASSQELDGDVSFSEDFNIFFEISPVIDDGDGVSNLNPSFSTTEGFLESNASAAIPLLNINGEADNDIDDSEEILFYDIDIIEVARNAKIVERLRDLELEDGVDPAAFPTDNLGLAQLILDKYFRDIDGAFTFPSGTFNGTIRVDPNTEPIFDTGNGGFGSEVRGLAFNRELFLDSNEDFEIPFRVRLRDSATLSSGEVEVESTQFGTYSISIDGTADVPTVEAEDVTGAFLTPLNITVNFTDTDLALGRDLSETLVAFVQLQEDLGGNLTDYAFVDAGGRVVGQNAGGKTCDGSVSAHSV